MDAAPTILDRDATDALGEQIAEHAAHIDAATHRLLTDIRVFDQSGGWHRQAARTCDEWLSWRLGWDGGRSREHVRVATRLGELPLIDDALRRGELSYSKVRAMVRVATAANEALLLEAAKYSTGTQLETICRKYGSVSRRSRPTREEDAVLRTIAKHDRDDGMISINVVLHPEEAALVWEALTKVAREREEGARFCRTDALVQLAEGVLRGDRPDRSPTELVVTVAADVLDGSNPDALQVATTSDGTAVSAETARRLACDCGVVYMTEDEHGTPLSVGRKTRSIPSTIKRAMIKRDRCCRFPGCGNRIYMEGHHLKHWADGGETALKNIVSLCSFHHRFVHEYGYRVALDANEDPTFFDPRGRIVKAVPESRPPPGLGWPAIKRMNAPHWDGDPVNYDLVIEDLCRKDPAPDPAMH
jgi:hypothetical protein